MKRNKKLFSALLSLAMLFALTQPALAGNFNNEGALYNLGTVENTGTLANRGRLMNIGRFVNAAGTVENFAYRVGKQIEGTVRDDFRNGEGGVIHYEIKDETLTVGGTGAIPDMSTDGVWDFPLPWEINESSFIIAERPEITRIVIEEGVTAIGAGAFAHCFPHLASISLPSTLTRIGADAFAICEELTSVTIPAGVTSIGQRAFAECPSLTEIRVEDGNETFASVDGVLFTKDLKTLVAYPDAASTTGAYDIPVGVTAVGDFAFMGARLSALGIPASVTSIGEGAFEGSELQSAKFPDGIREIPIGAFAGCKELTSVTIPASVAHIGEYAFYLCPLETVNYYGSADEFTALLASAGAHNEKLERANVIYVGSSEILFATVLESDTRMMRCFDRSGRFKRVYMPGKGTPLLSGWYLFAYSEGGIASADELTRTNTTGLRSLTAQLGSDASVYLHGSLRANADTAFIVLDRNFALQKVVKGAEAAMDIVPAANMGTDPNAYYLYDEDNTIAYAVIVGSLAGERENYGIDYMLEYASASPTGRLTATLTLPNDQTMPYAVVLVDSNGNRSYSITAYYSRQNNTLALADLPAGVYTDIELHETNSNGTLLCTRQVNGSLTVEESNAMTPIDETVATPVTRRAFSSEYGYTLNCLLSGFSYTALGHGGLTSANNYFLDNEGCDSFSLTAEKWQANETSGGYVCTRCKPLTDVSVKDENATPVYFYATRVDEEKYLAYGIRTDMAYGTATQALDVGYKLSQSHNLPEPGCWYACSWSNGDMILTPIALKDYNSQGVYCYQTRTNTNTKFDYGTLSAMAADDKTVYYYYTADTASGESVTAYTGLTIELPAVEGARYHISGLFDGTQFRYAVVTKAELG